MVNGLLSSLTRTVFVELDRGPSRILRADMNDADQNDLPQWLMNYSRTKLSANPNHMDTELYHRMVSACVYLNNPPYRGLPVYRKVADEQKGQIRAAGGEWLACTPEERTKGFPFGFFVAHNIVALDKLLQLPFWSIALISGDGITATDRDIEKVLNAYFQDAKRRREGEKRRLKSEKEEANRVMRRSREKQSSLNKITKNIPDSKLAKLQKTASNAFHLKQKA